MALAHRAPFDSLRLISPPLLCRSPVIAFMAHASPVSTETILSSPLHSGTLCALCEVVLNINAQYGQGSDSLPLPLRTEQNPLELTVVPQSP